MMVQMPLVVPLLKYTMERAGVKIWYGIPSKQSSETGFYEQAIIFYHIWGTEHKAQGLISTV